MSDNLLPCTATWHDGHDHRLDFPTLHATRAWLSAEGVAVPRTQAAHAARLKEGPVKSGRYVVRLSNYE